MRIFFENWKWKIFFKRVFNIDRYFKKMEYAYQVPVLSIDTVIMKITSNVCARIWIFLKLCEIVHFTVMVVKCNIYEDAFDNCHNNWLAQIE